MCSNIAETKMTKNIPVEIRDMIIDSVNGDFFDLQHKISESIEHHKGDIGRDPGIEFLTRRAAVVRN